MHSFARLTQLFLLAATVSTVLGQDSIPDLPIADVCNASPCHAAYIENGVSIVRQRIIGNPNIENGVACCNYNLFTSSVDPPVCCYNIASLDLIDDRSRFSCPLRGVSKPTNCPSPTETCERIRRFVREFCKYTKQAQDFLEKIPIARDFFIPTCPTAGLLDVSSNFINLAVDKFFGPAPNTITDKDAFNVAQQASISLLAVGVQKAVIELVTANAAKASVLVALGPIYAGFCNAVVGVVLFNAVCRAVTTRFDDSACPNTQGILKRSQLLSSEPVAPVALEPRQNPSSNPCLDALQLFPSEAQCSDITQLNCTSILLDLAQDEDFYNDDELETIRAQCQTAQSVQFDRFRVCAIRKAFADFVPFCGADAVSTTTTPAISSTSFTSSSTFSFGNTTSAMATSSKSQSIDPQSRSSTTAITSEKPGSWPAKPSTTATKKYRKGGACPVATKRVVHNDWNAVDGGHAAGSEGWGH